MGQLKIWIMYNYNLILKYISLIFLLSVLSILLNKINIKYQSNNNFTIHYIGESNFPIYFKESLNDIAIDFFNINDTLSKDINTALLEELILENKYIKKAEVYLDLEGAANIYVYFDQPFVKMVRNNKVVYLDFEGFELPPLLHVDTNLLVVSGDVNKNNFDYIQLLTKTIYNHTLLNNLIGGVHYDTMNGYTLSAKICDLGINLGANPILDINKIDMIEAFYNFLSNNLSCDYCKFINVAHDGQVICIK